jgi:hypothetical protein
MDESIVNGDTVEFVMDLLVDACNKWVRDALHPDPDVWMEAYLRFFQAYRDPDECPLLVACGAILGKKSSEILEGLAARANFPI